MPDTYTSTLGTIVMSVGGDNNTWGTNLNNAVFQILEDAIANQLTSAVTGGTLDLSTNPPPAGPSAARYAILKFTGTLAANQIVKVPNLTKIWLVNSTGLTNAGFTLTFTTPSGSPSNFVPAGGWCWVWCDGANNIYVSPFASNLALMPNGSAAAPSYAFYSEVSGWYRNGLNDIRLAIGGADVLQVTGAGAGTPSIVNVLSPNILQQQGAQIVPAGTELAYAGISLPAGGWLWEDGSAYSRATYVNLFNALTATVTGNTHSSTSIDGLAADMRGKGLNGALVEGTGIPTGTTITFTGAATATLSQAATSTSSGITLRILPYGQGDASTTFNLPDRRGRTLFARDDLNGSAAGRITVNAGTHLNTAGGEEVHTLVTGEMPSHNHGATVSEPNGGQGHQHGLPFNVTVFGGQAQTTVGGGIANLLQNNGAAANTSLAATGIGVSTAATGGGAAHNNMPPFGISNYIIKT
jgi:microcystin-dependent protein